jgi:hypothetical protein
VGGDHRMITPDVRHPPSEFRQEASSNRPMH